MLTVKLPDTGHMLEESGGRGFLWKKAYLLGERGNKRMSDMSPAAAIHWVW